MIPRASSPKTLTPPLTLTVCRHSPLVGASGFAAQPPGGSQSTHLDSALLRPVLGGWEDAGSQVQSGSLRCPQTGAACPLPSCCQVLLSAGDSSPPTTGLPSVWSRVHGVEASSAGILGVGRRAGWAECRIPMLPLQGAELGLGAQ
jgi:hypothetical protein